jgi:nucleoside phosphorylase
MAVDIAITDPCVVFALRRESMYFRRCFSFRQRFPGAPCPAEFRGSASRSVLMLETGVGAAAMEKALHWCLNAPRFDGTPYRPRFVLSIGFSGALQVGQRVGDLILATEIIDLQRSCWLTYCPRSQALLGNARWRSSASRPAPRQDGKQSFPTRVPKQSLGTREVRTGRLLTVPELVGDPREKQRLGERYKALAVDMETAVVARLCQEHDTPLLCLRVISDDLNAPLSPHLVELLRRGRVAPPRLVGTILRHPSLIRELWRLAGQTRFAARQLLAGVSEFLFGPLVPEEDGWRHNCGRGPWRP